MARHKILIILSYSPDNKSENGVNFYLLFRSLSKLGQSVPEWCRAGLGYEIWQMTNLLAKELVNTRTWLGLSSNFSCSSGWARDQPSDFLVGLGGFWILEEWKCSEAVQFNKFPKKWPESILKPEIFLLLWSLPLLRVISNNVVMGGLINIRLICSS